MAGFFHFLCRARRSLMAWALLNDLPSSGAGDGYVDHQPAMADVASCGDWDLAVDDEVEESVDDAM